MSHVVVMVLTAIFGVVTVATGVAIKVTDSKIVEVSPTVDTLLRVTFVVSFVICMGIQILFWIS